MTTTAMKPVTQLGQATVEAAARATRITMNSAERAMGVQMDYARGALKRMTMNARAVSQAKDAQELLALRTRMAETALQNLIGYSRNLYDVATEAQAEYASLAQERISILRKAMADNVDHAVRSAPAGSDAAATAIRNQFAAATAALDSFTKAASMASIADFGSAASRPARSRKVT